MSKHSFTLKLNNFVSDILIFNHFTWTVCTGGEVKLKIFLLLLPWTIFRLNQIHFSKYAVNGKVACPAFSQSNSLMRASEIYLLVKLAWKGGNSPVSVLAFKGSQTLFIWNKQAKRHPTNLPHPTPNLNNCYRWLYPKTLILCRIKISLIRYDRY